MDIFFVLKNRNNASAIIDTEYETAARTAPFRSKSRFKINTDENKVMKLVKTAEARLTVVPFLILTALIHAIKPVTRGSIISIMRGSTARLIS